MFRFFTFATIAILLYVPVLLLAQEKNALPQSVHFPIDKSFVIYDYPENESTFSDIHAQIINVIKGKQKKINQINITGFSSPEGNYTRNTKLATERAEKMERYVHSLIPDVKVNIYWVSEDWQGLATLIEKENPAWKEQVTTICYSEKNLVQKEKLLRALSPNIYRTLAKDYFPKLRRTELTIEAEALNETTKHSETATNAPMEIILPATDTKHRPNVSQKKCCTQRKTQRHHNAHLYSANIQQRALKARYGTENYKHKQKRKYILYNEHPTLAIGSNLITWAGFRPDFTNTTFTPNIYTEYYFLNRWSVKGEFAYSNWEYGNNNFQGISSYTIEPRFWIKGDGSFKGLYIGLYGQIGDFNDQTSNGNYTGTYHSEGISVGLIWPLYAGLAIEIGIRGGYQSADVKNYLTQETCEQEVCNKKEYTFTKDGFAISACTLGILYRF